MDWTMILIPMIALMFFMLYRIGNDLSAWIKHLTTMQAEQSKRMDKVNERLDKHYEQLLELVRVRKI